MEGLLPVSKSSMAMGRKCLKHLHNKKVLKIPDGDTIAASIGRDVHEWRAKILPGATSLETALAEISDPETTDLLCQTIAKSVYPYEPNQKLEIHYQNPQFHGYIDRCGRVNNRLFAEDLKTGRWEDDDEQERDLYSVLAWDALATPEDKEMVFVRFFCRSGNHHEFIYTPEGIEDARERTLLAVAELEAAEPIPNPGAHCLNWYGRPCGYHGTEHCPLAADVPALVDATLPVEMAAIGQAFMAIYRGDFDAEIPPTIASLALQGVHQIEAAAKIVKETLKSWAETNGPIEVGDKDKFGWYPVSDYEVNKTFALQVMLGSQMPTEEIAKTINLSKAAIERISKRRYPELRQSILDLAVTRSGGTKRRFGKIKATD